MAEVRGSWRAFSAGTGTTRPEEVWRAWTTPSTWGTWDRGLRSAELSGPFTPGATGSLVDRSGRRSRFTVTGVDPGRRCVVDVVLPGAVLHLTRSLDGLPGGVTARHEVRFTGALGPLWALLLGPGFRRLLGPTVDAVVASAEGRGG